MVGCSTEKKLPTESSTSPPRSALPSAAFPDVETRAAGVVALAGISPLGPFSLQKTNPSLACEPDSI